MRAALKNPEASGRILLDGAPPENHSYDEAASYLERRFPKQTDSVKSHVLRMMLRRLAKSPDGWHVSDARIRFIDEFDDLPRSDMEAVLAMQKHGIRSKKLFEQWGGPWPRAADDEDYNEADRKRRKRFENMLHPFVLVATAWEKRLPKAVRARFATVIPVQFLDWESLKPQN